MPTQLAGQMEILLRHREREANVEPALEDARLHHLFQVHLQRMRKMKTGREGTSHLANADISDLHLHSPIRSPAAVSRSASIGSVRVRPSLARRCGIPGRLADGSPT